MRNDYHWGLPARRLAAITEVIVTGALPPIVTKLQDRRSDRHQGSPVRRLAIITEAIVTGALPLEAKTRQFGDEKCLSSIWRVFASRGREQDEALALAKETLKVLEGELGLKKFFGGETIGLVDISLGCIANMIGTLEEIIGLKMIEEETFPKLSEWIENFSDFPAIQNTFPPRDRMLTKFRIIREALFAKQDTDQSVA